MNGYRVVMSIADGEDTDDIIGRLKAVLEAADIEVIAMEHTAVEIAALEAEAGVLDAMGNPVPKEVLRKHFFVMDKTGRGKVVHLSYGHIIDYWEDEEDMNGQMLSEWLSESELGDVWETNSVKLTRSI